MRNLALRCAWIPAIVGVGLSSCTKVESPAAVQGFVPVVTSPSGIEIVSIPGGEFRMGDSRGNEDESPAHRVRLDPFLMDRYEVTQARYEELMGENPSKVKGPGHPVEMVTWVLAALYCNARSEAEGLDPCYDEDTAECDRTKSGYRLPTEAEWEYACRAGTESEYSFGDDARSLDDYAWHAGNSAKKTHPVGQKMPNPWGLYDMHGNAAEWTNDIYDATYYQRSPVESPPGPAEGKRYVVRGGSWKDSPEVLRSAYRVADNPGFTDACLAPDTLGFRCVRNAPRKPKGATGLLHGSIYSEHRVPEDFPERPERLEAILRGLEESGLLSRLERIKPAPADTKWITVVHSAEYVNRLRSTCEGLGDRIATFGSADVPISARSYEVAIQAVGGVLAAIDAIVEGRVRNAFCAIRPPGHHARRDRAMGFCLLNTVAIAARYVQKRHGLSRVLIVDWDVHHGNGTEEIFYEDPSVLYFSTHLHPFYPMTGEAARVGAGEGRGSNINVPLKPGDGDREIEEAFRETLVPAAETFRPDFVVISCGFDAHEGDLLGQLKVTSEGFGRLTRIVRQIAEKSCGGRLVSVLEGGYALDRLAAASVAHVRALME